MGWVKDALAGLKKGKSVTVRPFGHSMTGIIESGQKITIAPISNDPISKGDIVFLKWKGNHILHLVVAQKETQYLIANNLGKINGLVSKKDIIGKVIFIEY